MKPAVRLLAAVQRSSRFLEPGAPTGLTGLATHPSPRSTLLYIYSSTLEKLAQFPEHSVYRQSTEALTKHRIGVIESIKPAGLAEWQQRVDKQVDEFPEAFRKVPITSGGGGSQDYNIVFKEHVKLPDDEVDGRKSKSRSSALAEGPQWTEQDRKAFIQRFEQAEEADRLQIPEIESEPSLTAEQIGEIENKIGAGLIEEIVQVAEGERELVNTLFENKVWEELEEKPVEGQWAYNERDRYTGVTQAH